jgi:hypothetical protein
MIPIPDAGAKVATRRIPGTIHHYCNKMLESILSTPSQHVAYSSEAGQIQIYCMEGLPPRQHKMHRGISFQVTV